MERRTKPFVWHKPATRSSTTSPTTARGSPTQVTSCLRATDALEWSRGPVRAPLRRTVEAGSRDSRRDAESLGEKQRPVYRDDVAASTDRSTRPRPDGDPSMSTPSRSTIRPEAGTTVGGGEQLMTGRVVDDVVGDDRRRVADVGGLQPPGDTPAISSCHPGLRQHREHGVRSVVRARAEHQRDLVVAKNVERVACPGSRCRPGAGDGQGRRVEERHFPRPRPPPSVPSLEAIRTRPPARRFESRSGARHGRDPVHRGAPPARRMLRGAELVEQPVPRPGQRRPRWTGWVPTRITIASATDSFAAAVTHRAHRATIPSGRAAGRTCRSDRGAAAAARLRPGRGDATGPNDARGAGSNERPRRARSGSRPARPGPRSPRRAREARGEVTVGPVRVLLDDQHASDAAHARNLSIHRPQSGTRTVGDG